MSASRWRSYRDVDAALVAPDLDQGVTDAVLEQSATSAEQADWVGRRLPAMFEEADLLTRGEAFAMVLFLHLVGVRAAT